jgi:adenine-specific DNA-methyltransferase
MTIKETELISSINKAYRLVKPKRIDLDGFKANLLKLISLIDIKESEENVKIHLMDFLKNTFYNPNYLIATKGKTDFVIHLGKEASSFAGVLFEVKKPTNITDMITKSDFNKKAMHELILYFLRERLNNKNNSLTNIIITNVY